MREEAFRVEAVVSARSGTTDQDRQARPRPMGLRVSAGLSTDLKAAADRGG